MFRLYKRSVSKTPSSKVLVLMLLLSIAVPSYLTFGITNSFAQAFTKATPELTDERPTGMDVLVFYDESFGNTPPGERLEALYFSTKTKKIQKFEFLKFPNATTFIYDVVHHFSTNNVEMITVDNSPGELSAQAITMPGGSFIRRAIQKIKINTKLSSPRLVNAAIDVNDADGTVYYLIGVQGQAPGDNMRYELHYAKKENGSLTGSIKIYDNARRQLSAPFINGSYGIEYDPRTTNLSVKFAVDDTFFFRSGMYEFIIRAKDGSPVSPSPVLISSGLRVIYEHNLLSPFRRAFGLSTDTEYSVATFGTGSGRERVAVAFKDSSGQWQTAIQLNQLVTGIAMDVGPVRYIHPILFRAAMVEDTDCSSYPIFCRKLTLSESRIPYTSWKTVTLDQINGPPSFLNHFSNVSMNKHSWRLGKTVVVSEKNVPSKISLEAYVCDANLNCANHTLDSADTTSKKTVPKVILFR